MADNETNVTNEQQTEQQTEQQQAAAEKKYTDEEVNNISKKNSDKAIAKLLKDLGIDATDEGKAAAKQLIAEHKAKQKASETEKAAEDGSKLAAAVQRAVTAQGTIALIGKGVPADRAGRFAKLLDLSDVADENGDIDTDKMAAAVDSLLAEWPEALPKAEDRVGFKVGSNGKETKDTDTDNEMDKWRKDAGLKK